jgi:hypothetical protein
VTRARTAGARDRAKQPPRPAARKSGPLLVLVDGPLDRRWYWVSDWESHCAAIRYMRDRMGELWPDDHPSLTSLRYHPTGDRIPHPWLGTWGAAWTYDPNSNPE